MMRTGNAHAAGTRALALKESGMNAIGKFSPLVRLGFMALLIGASTVAVAADSPDEARAKIQKVSGEVLERLYKVQPAARKVIADSKGYATFSKWGLTIGVVGGGIGKGLAVTKPSNKPTYMRYVEGSAGFGLGIKKYDLIFVFLTEKALSDFINKGWEYSGQGTAAAKSGSTGLALDGAVSVSPGVWLYQNTSSGLMAEIGIKGTKYYKDTTLN
jgi:lipid-binding SYLF domain-containing protein